MSNTRERDTSEEVALTAVDEPEIKDLAPIEPEAIYPVDPNVVRPDPNAEVETPEQQESRRQSRRSSRDRSE